MFFQIDDQFQVNPKARALAERLLSGDLMGLAAIGLWTMAGSLCQASLTDGVVTKADLARLTLNPAEAERIAALLVEVGLWHTPGHSCSRCPAVEQGTYLFHDWFALGYETGGKVKVTRAKRAELKDAELIARVWARDCRDPSTPQVGDCRYCGKELYKNSRRGKRRWEIDHVDPSVAHGARNLALVCADCNREKGNRTPEAAGFTLRPPPRHSRQDVKHTPTVVGADSRAVEPGSSRDVARVDPRDGEGNARRGGLRQVGEDPSAVEPGSSRDAAPVDPRPGVEAPNLPGATAEAAPEPERNLNAMRGKPPQPESKLITPAMDAQCDSELSRPRAYACAGQAGQGRAGSGLGEVGQDRAGQGEVGQGKARPGKRRRRRRPKSTAQPASPPDPQQHSPAPSADPACDAGEAPEVRMGGKFGSPWLGYSGRQTTDELDCEVHGLPAPCRKCGDG